MHYRSEACQLHGMKCNVCLPELCNEHCVKRSRGLLCDCLLLEPCGAQPAKAVLSFSLFMYVCIYLAAPGFSCTTPPDHSLSLFTFLHWRRKWHPTPVFLRHAGFLVAASEQELQHVGSSSLTRDQTWALCIGSMESATKSGKSPHSFFYIKKSLKGRYYFCKSE